MPIFKQSLGIPVVGDIYRNTGAGLNETIQNIDDGGAETSNVFDACNNVDDSGSKETPTPDVIVSDNGDNDLLDDNPQQHSIDDFLFNLTKNFELLCSLINILPNLPLILINF